MEKQNNKNIDKKEMNKNFLRQVAGTVNNICTEVFGSSCAFRPVSLVNKILGENQDLETFSEGWKNLLSRVDASPLDYRQCLVIKIVAELHDMEMAVKDNPIEVSKYYTCTHWWLVGADEIRRIAELPEVDAVLRETHIIRGEISVCGHNPQVVRHSGQTLYSDFKHLYEVQALKQQQKYNVTADNLQFWLLRGKNFYKYTPDQVVSALETAPILATAVVRDISNHVPLWRKGLDGKAYPVKSFDPLGREEQRQAK